MTEPIGKRVARPRVYCQPGIDLYDAYCAAVDRSGFEDDDELALTLPEWRAWRAHLDTCDKCKWKVAK